MNVRIMTNLIIQRGPQSTNPPLAGWSSSLRFCMVMMVLWPFMIYVVLQLNTIGRLTIVVVIIYILTCVASLPIRSKLSLLPTIPPIRFGRIVSKIIVILKITVVLVITNYLNIIV